MYILNIEDRKDILKKSLKLNGLLSTWLIRKGVSPLGISKDKNYHYFSITKEVIDILDNVPFYLKPFVPEIERGGVDDT